MNNLFSVLVVLVMTLVGIAVCSWGIFGNLDILLAVIGGVGDYLIPTAIWLTVAVNVIFAIKVFFFDK
jgi:hypothetical protein